MHIWKQAYSHLKTACVGCLELKLEDTCLLTICCVFALSIEAVVK